MFRTVPLSIIRSFSLFACLQAVSKPVWHIPLLCVQRKTPDDGQRNCPKHVEFNSKNKFEKFLHLVGFVTRITSGNNEIMNNISYPYTLWRSTVFRMCYLHLLCDWICFRWMMKWLGGEMSVGFKETFQIICTMRLVGRDKGDRSFTHPFQTTYLSPSSDWL